MTAVVPSTKRQAPRAPATADTRWIGLSVIAMSIAQLGLLVLLGRTLEPAEFGVAAAVLAVASLPRMIIGSTLPAPIIQRREIDVSVERTAATLSVLVTTSVAVALWLVAELVAALFSIDEVATWVRWMALVLPVFGLAITPQALLWRELRFREAANVDTAAFLFGYLLGGAIAVHAGAGAGAIVIALAAEAGVRLVLSMTLRPVVPTVFPDTQHLRSMVSFAGSVGLGGALNLLATRGDYVVISRVFGAVPLGAYTQAYQLAYYPSLVLGRVNERWLFPVLSRRRSESDDGGATFLRSLSVLGFVVGAAAVATAVLAEPAIRLVFGSGWDAAVVPLQVLAIGAPFRILYTACDAYTKAAGAVGRRAVIQGVYASAVIAFAVVGASFSLSWAAAGVVLAVALNYVLMLRLSLRAGNLTWARVAMAHSWLAGGAVISALTLAVVVPTAQMVGFGDLGVIALSAVTIGSAMAAGAAAFVGRSRTIHSHERSGGASTNGSGAGAVVASRPALTVIAQLIEDLDAAGVEAVVFKGETRIDAALRGEADLDLVIRPEERSHADSILESLGFIAVESAPSHRLPGTTDWFGVDRPSGQLVHVQLATEIWLGPAQGPGVRLPGLHALIARADRVDAIRWARPADAAVVRLCDAALATRLDVGRGPNERLLEARSLAARLQSGELEHAAATLFDEDVAAAFAAVAEGRSRRRLRRALLRRHDAGTRRFSVGRLAARAGSSLNRRIGRQPMLARRRLSRPAPVVAVVGSDGAGKSSATAGAVRRLDAKIDCRFYYFGTGDGPATVAGRLARTAKRRWGDRQKTDAPLAEPTAPRVSATRAMWAIVTANERRVTSRRAKRAVARGFIVITDRFPQNEFIGIHDGPRLPLGVGGRVLGRIARWEHRQYEKLTSASPARVVVLDVPLDVARARRPDEPVAELSRRIEVVRALRFPGSRRTIVDATLSPDEVIGHVLCAVLAEVRR